MRRGLKVLLPSLLLLLSAAGSARAQSEGPGPISAQLGLGGGPYLGMQAVSLPELDVRLANMGLEPLPEWLDLAGGSGSFHIGHVLVGGQSWSGTVSRSASPGGILRETRLDLSWGGVTAGYVKAAGRLKMTLGTSLGGGTLLITATRRPSAGPTWDGVWQYYETGFTGTVDAADLDISTRLEGRYFLVEPFLSMRYRVWRFIHLDLGAFYHWGKVGAGKLEQNGSAIPDAPALDLSGMGFRFGLFLGL